MSKEEENQAIKELRRSLLDKILDLNIRLKNPKLHPAAKKAMIFAKERLKFKLNDAQRYADNTKTPTT